MSSYLPDLVDVAPVRYRPGPLSSWLHSALKDEAEHDRDRVMTRVEVLYARRRANRAWVEPQADLAKETQWLLEVLPGELASLIPSTSTRSFGAILGRLRNSLRLYESSDES